MENQNDMNIQEPMPEAQEVPAVDASEGDQPENKKKKSSLLFNVLSWVVTIVVGVGLALLVNSFILINAQVISGSMKDTLQIGDRLMGARFTYWFSEPQRGDIIVFKYPIENALGKSDDYIKRIIGLPGETIEIRNAQIFINGSEKPLDEPYLKETWTRMSDGMTFVVPENSYFVLGDNRNNSSDSRYWAGKALETVRPDGTPLVTTLEEAESYSYVPKNLILGKAYLCYWPLNQLKWYSNPSYEGQ